MHACIHTCIHDMRTHIHCITSIKYMHTNIHTSKHTCIHTSIHTYMHAYFTCVNTFITYINTHTYTSNQLLTYKQTYIHTHIHTHTSTHIHTYTHIQTNTRIHTWMQACMRACIPKHTWHACTQPYRYTYIRTYIQDTHIHTSQCITLILHDITLHYFALRVTTSASHPNISHVMSLHHHTLT